MLRKKKTFADEAREWAEEVVDTVRPHVDTARVAVDDFVHDRAVPALHDARDSAQPYLAAGAASLAEQAEHARDAAQNLSDQVAESAGRPRKKKRSKIKMLLIIGAVGGAAAFAAKKLQGGNDQPDAWTPPTPATPVHSTESAPTEMTEESEKEQGTQPGASAQRPDPLSDPIPPEDKA